MTTPLLWLASSLAHSLPRHAARRLPASLPTVHQRTRRRPLCTCAPEELHVAGLSYDLETTGIGPDAEIVQIAVHVANSARAEPPSFQSLVMPSGPIQPGATAVHGFTRESLEAADAQQFGTVWGELEEWLQATLGSERPLVWCAHNGDRFDHPILTRACRAVDADLRGDDAYAHWRFHDTLPLARRVLPGGTAQGGHSLGALYAEATGGGGFDNAHDALADARALTTVWRWISTVEMGIAAPGAADEQARTRCFQAELQRLGYEAAAPPKARAARGGAAAAASPSKAKAAMEKAKAAREKAAAAPPLSGAAPLLEVPGVGPATAKRLASRGLETVDELLRAATVDFPTSDAKKAVRAYCKRYLPGIVKPVNLAKLAAACARAEPAARSDGASP